MEGTTILADSSSVPSMSKAAMKKQNRASAKAQSREAAALARLETARLQSLDCMQWCRECLKYNEFNFDLSSTILKRVALFFQYSGTNYRGVQVQNRDTQPTVERQLMHALYRVGGFSDDSSLTFRDLRWMRTARTDRGVHAACNLLTTTLRIEEEKEHLLQERLNAVLPSDIRVFAIRHICQAEQAEYIVKRHQDTTASSSSEDNKQSALSTAISQLGPYDICDFHAKNSCTGRTYEYLMPSAVFKLHLQPSEYIPSSGAIERQSRLSSQEASSSDPSSTGHAPTAASSSSDRVSGTDAHYQWSVNNFLAVDSFSVAELDTISTRFLHRLLKGVTKGIEAARKSTVVFLQPDAPIPTGLRRQVLQHFLTTLPTVFQLVGNLRESLYKLRKDNVAPFEPKLDLAKMQLDEINHHINRELSTLPPEETVTLANITDSILSDLINPSLLPLFTCLCEYEQAADAAKRSLDAKVCSVATSASASLQSDDVSSTSLKPFLDPSLFKSTRLQSEEIERIQAVLSQLKGRKDFHNFTEIDPRMIQKPNNEPSPSPAASSASNCSVTEDASASPATATEKRDLSKSHVYFQDASKLRDMKSIKSLQQQQQEQQAESEDAAERDDASQQASLDEIVHYTQRLVTECRIGELFYVDGVEYCRILIQGHSFMLHQIRKMMSLAVLVVRRLVPVTIFQSVFEPQNNIEIPPAPARGLLLTGFEFERYERMCALMPNAGIYSMKKAVLDHKVAISHFQSQVLEKEICDFTPTHAAFRMWLLQAMESQTMPQNPNAAIPIKNFAQMLSMNANEPLAEK